MRSIRVVAVILPLLICTCGADRELMNEYDKLQDFATELYFERRYDEALEQGHKALQIAQQELDNDRLVSVSQGLLARTYSKLGNFSKADSLFKESMRIGVELGAVEGFSLATRVHNYGQFCYERGRDSEARSLLEDAIQLYEQSGSANTIDHALALHRLGLVLESVNELEAATQRYLEAIAIWREVSPEHYNLAASLERLAIVYRDAERYQLAESLYLEAQQINESQFDSTSYQVVGGVASLGRFLVAAGRLAEAEATWLRAISLATHSAENLDTWLAHYRSELGYCYLQLGRISDAGPLILSGLEQLQTLTEGDDTRLARAIMRLGQLRAKQQRGAEAESLLVRAVEVAEMGSETASWILCLTQEGLASFYVESQHHDQAVSVFEELVASTESVYGVSHPKAARTLLDYASVLRSIGRGGQAEVLERRAQYILSRQ